MSSDTNMLLGFAIVILMIIAGYLARISHHLYKLRIALWEVDGMIRFRR